MIVLKLPLDETNYDIITSVLPSGTYIIDDNNVCAYLTTDAVEILQDSQLIKLPVMLAYKVVRD